MTGAAGEARLTLVTQETASFPVPPNTVLHAFRFRSRDRVQLHGLFPNKRGSDVFKAAQKRS